MNKWINIKDQKPDNDRFIGYDSFYNLVLECKASTWNKDFFISSCGDDDVLDAFTGASFKCLME